MGILTKESFLTIFFTAKEHIYGLTDKGIVVFSDKD